MKEAEKIARASADVRNYMLFSFAALLGMVPVLLMKGMDLWSIFPLILGALSLMAHWKAGPALVVLSLVVQVVLKARGYDPVTCLQLGVQLMPPPSMTGTSFTPVTPFLDFLLAVCVVTYTAGHYRMQSLVYYIVPPDARPRIMARSSSVVAQSSPSVVARSLDRATSADRRSPAASGDLRSAERHGQETVPQQRGGKGKAAEERLNPRRTPGLLGKWEIPLLALTALLSALAAQYVWRYIRTLEPRGRLDISVIGWRTLMFVWFCALLLLVSWAVFSYVRRRRATREESLLYLQDQLWLQTRREQGRLNRWLAWARLRGQRRKEQPS